MQTKRQKNIQKKNEKRRAKVRAILKHKSKTEPKSRLKIQRQHMQVMTEMRRKSESRKQATQSLSKSVGSLLGIDPEGRSGANPISSQRGS